mgnify:CR=1 FL=1
MPVIDMLSTGKNIEYLRKKNNMTVRELQNIMGFETPNTIYKWQHGTTLPTVDNLVVLAAIFKVKIDDILIVEK